MNAKRWQIALVAALAMVVTACGGGEGEGTDTVSVVATTTILGDVVANVVADGASLEVIMPVGADAHDFQASSQQVSSMSTADLVVGIGLGLEEGLHDTLESAEADGVRVLELAPLLDPIVFGSEVSMSGCDPDTDLDHEDEVEGDGHASCDPHVWMDPLRMAEAALLIAAELEEIAPGGGWGDRAEAYASELIEANDEIVAILSSVPEESRKLVTNHEALGYFAEAYDFEVVGVVIPGGSTLGDPSSAELADLVETITAEQVQAIFTDSSSPSGLAEAVAEEVGSEVVVVGLYTESLGEPGSGADTLIGLLTTNARSIADSLS